MRLFHLPGSPGLVFISHDTEREIETRDGRKIDRVQPTMSKQALGVIESLVDLIIAYQYDGRERVAKICGAESIVAGCRLEHRFLAKDGERVESIPMGDSPAESFANFLRAFNNKQETSGAEEPAEKPPSKTEPAKKKPRFTLSR